MLSRRSIRIKVMQHLYMLNRDVELDEKNCINSYNKTLEQVFGLYLYSLYILVSITEIAKDDALKRQSKYIKNEEDFKFSSKLHENSLIQSFVNSKDFQKYCEDRNFADRTDRDLLQRIYKSYAATQSYRDYIQIEATTDDHLEIILDLFRFCRRNEHYNDLMEDFSYTWLDDKSLVVGVVKKTIKELPIHEDVFGKHYPDNETAIDYGAELLRKTIEHHSELNAYIEPIVSNWDIDRLALVDLLFIRMACSEFLYFASIPTKVTLNEYVDLAKAYSTERSKDFINGVLDKIMKSFVEKEQISKEGRGLVC